MELTHHAYEKKPWIVCPQCKNSARKFTKGKKKKIFRSLHGPNTEHRILYAYTRTTSDSSQSFSYWYKMYKFYYISVNCFYLIDFHKIKNKCSEANDEMVKRQQSRTMSAYYLIEICLNTWHLRLDNGLWI